MSSRCLSCTTSKISLVYRDKEKNCKCVHFTTSKFYYLWYNNDEISFKSIPKFIKDLLNLSGQSAPKHNLRCHTLLIILAEVFPGSFKPTLQMRNNVFSMYNHLWKMWMLIEDKMGLKNFITRLKSWLE